jgi:hypothetical protein
MGLQRALPSVLSPQCGKAEGEVHPGLRIQDHEEVTLRVVCLAVDEPKGDPAQNE